MEKKCLNCFCNFNDLRLNNPILEIIRLHTIAVNTLGKLKMI